MPTIEGANLFAEGGDFDHLFAIDDGDDAEGFTDGNGFWKEGFNLFGVGIGGDVIIVGRAAHELVAYTAASKEGNVAFFL